MEEGPEESTEAVGVVQETTEATEETEPEATEETVIAWAMMTNNAGGTQQ